MPVYIRNILLFLLLISPAACESDVKNVSLTFEQKLVITSFISPSDSITYFNVSSNKRLYGEINPKEPIGNISGTLSDGLKEVVLDTARSGFILDHRKMRIEAGKTYHLKVSSDLGLKAEAYSTVPGKKNFVIEADTFSVASVHPGDPFKRHTRIRVIIHDIPGEKNYYRIRGKVYNYYSIYNNDYPVTFEDDLLTDSNMDGQPIVEESNDMVNFSNSDSTLVAIYLFNTESSYYFYHKSLKEYSDGNPFSEATPVYSNISGGLGIFTSFTVDSAVIRLK
jgi:hypothetical protein